MRILHVITSLRTGGAEKLMVELLPRLYQLNELNELSELSELRSTKSTMSTSSTNTVELLVFDGVRTPFYEELERRGVKIHSFEENCNVYNPLFVFKLIPYLKQFDVVHTHNTACQMFVAMANVFVGTRIVTTEHSTSNRRRKYPLLKWLDSWMYHQYETIVTVSDIAGRNIRDYVGDQNLPIRTIANGIDVKRFADSEPCKELVQQYADVFKAVMVAGFRYEKDHKTVIKSFSLLPENYHLFLVGDGEERGACEELVASLGLSDRVHFLGIRSDVANILQASDVVIMSSHREGLSLSNLEGMASGKPFIASDVDGLHEIVDGYGVLFPHEDDKALAEVIKKCCEDKEYAAEVGRKCQEKAMMYDISVMAEGYGRLYG